MSAWEEVLIEWCNCLAISKKIEDFNELRDGDFFTNILCIINKSDEFKNEESTFKILLDILNNIYNNVQVEYTQYTSFSELSEDDLKIITSLLMHYTCIYDRRDILTSPLCHRLSKNTQVCIKSFLQKIDKEISYVDLENIIKELADNFNKVMFKNNDELPSPLMGILKTPVSKASRFHDKDREITKLKNMLDLERYEKADLQEELRLQNEKIKKFESSLNNSNSDIVRLKREISALESRTPPHFQAIDQTDKEKRLKMEIQSLEHYIEKTEKEQEDLREETYNSRKKLKEWELEYTNLHAKYLEYENKIEDLTKLSNNQAARITSLESYCEELNGLLEELQAKPANESSMFETSSVNVRPSFTLVEESLACSVVEVQLKESQNQNREMVSKIDTLNMQLDNNKKMLDTKMKEYITKYNKLREYTEKFTDIKVNIKDMKTYYEEEMKKFIIYIKEVKQIFFSVVVGNYEKLIENLSTALIKEKEISQSLSDKLADTVSKFEECNKELERNVIDKNNFLDNIARLAKLVDDLNEQKLELSTNLKKSEERNENFLDKIDTLEKDSVKYKYELDQLENEKNRYVSQIHSLENSQDELKGTNENLNSKLTISEEKNKEYTAKISLSEVSIENLKKELNQLLSDKNKYVNEFEMLRNEYEQLHSQNEDLSSKLITAVKSNSECTTRLRILEEEIQLKKNELDTIRSEKSECVSKIETMNGNYQKLTEKTEDLSLKLATSEETIEEYITKIKSFEETIEQRNDELNKITSEKDKYITQISNIQNDYDEMTNKAQELSSLNKEQNEKLIEKKIIEDDYINLKKSIVVYIEALNEIVEHLKRQQPAIEINKLQTSCKSVNKCGELNGSSEKLDEINQLGEQITNLNAYIHLYLDKQTLYLDEIECLKGELATTKINYQNLTEKSEDLSLKLATSEETIKEYISKMKSFEETIEQKNDELNEVTSEKDKYITQISNIRNDYEELTKKAQELSSLNEEKNEQLIEKKILEADYIALKKSVEEYINHIECLKGELATTKINYQSVTEKTEDLASKLATSEQTIEEYTAKMKSFEETIEQKNNELKEVTSEKDKYTTQISNIQSDYEELTKKAQELSSLNEEKNEQLIEKKILEADYIALKKSVEEYINDIECLRGELATTKINYQNLTLRTEELASNLATSEQTIQEYTTKIKSFEETIEQKNDELNEVTSEKDQYITQISNIRNDYEELTKKAQELSSLNEEKNEQLIGKKILEADYIALKKSVEEYINDIECLRGELATTKINYQSVTEKTEDLASKLATSEQTIEEYIAKIKSFEETIQQKNDELNEVTSEKDKYITQISNIQSDYEELTKKAQELSSLNEEKNEQLIAKKIMEEDYISLIKTISMYNEELNKVVKNLKRQQPVTEMSDLQRAYNSLSKLSELNSPEKCKSSGKLEEVNQLGEQISKINAYIHLFSEKETFYLNEIDSLKGELATSSTNYFDLTQNLKEQNSDNESLITSLTENLHSVIEKYNQLQAEHREYLNRINEYQEEVTKMKKTHSEITLTNELKITNLQDEILALEGEILSVKKNYDHMTETHENKIKLLVDELSGNKEEVNLLKEEVEKITIEYDVKVKTLEATITELEEEKLVAENKLQHLRAEYAAEVETLQKDISNNEELVNSLKQKCEDNEAKISTLQLQIVMAKEELSQFKNRSGRTEEEYQSTLANLQVQVVAGKLEVTKLSSKIDALLVEKEEYQRQIKAIEEERKNELQKSTTVSSDLEKERELNIQLRNELAKNKVILNEAGQYKELQEKYEKLQQENMNKKFLEEKQKELQQKIETLMRSNEMQKETYKVFKIYFKEFRDKLDKLLSQKNILEMLTNNLRVLVVGINKNLHGENVNLKTLFEKKEAMEVIAEDIMKQYNRCSKQTNDIVFDISKYYEKTCDNLLSTLDIKIENYSEKYNLEELNDQISDLTERTADALEQVKVLGKDLENLSKVEDVKLQKENILGTSRKINVDKMKEDEMKKKNLALRQKVTLLENAKSNLEKTVKKLREENKKIKEGCDKTAPSNNDAHYNMLLQEYVAYKEKHGDILKEYKTKLEQLQKEYEEHKDGCLRTSTPLGSERDLPSEAEKHLLADLNNLREAYSSIRSIKAKLENENVYSKKLIEEQKEEICKFNFMKEAYDKLLEENSKLMTDVDTMKYKRTRDRDEFLRLLKKERSENDSRNGKLLQEIRADYESKLEKMKEKMIKLYRDEVNKEMSKVKAGHHESTSLLKIIEQLKGDLFEAEQKVQVIEAERDVLKRSRDQSNLHGSRESFSSFQLHDSDTRSLRDFPASSTVCSSSVVAKSRAFSGVSRPQVEFKYPNAAKAPSLDARRQSEARRVSTLPRTGTVVEEVTLTRRTSFGVTDSIGPNMHMEDEEEMFNNKYLADLKQGKCDLPASDDRGSRVSELAWRNSLVPPHLKSSYPAEMQFCSPGRYKDDDIKTGNLPFDDSSSKLLPGEKPRKKDFGTTSYKKPGPPTPSKNGGRLSLQGNEVHPAREPPTEPKRSTPGRIRALFTGRNSSRSSTEVSPQKRRLNIFRR